MPVLTGFCGTLLYVKSKTMKLVSSDLLFKNNFIIISYHIIPEETLFYRPSKRDHHRNFVPVPYRTLSHTSISTTHKTQKRTPPKIPQTHLSIHLSIHHIIHHRNKPPNKHCTPLPLPSPYARTPRTCKPTPPPAPTRRSRFQRFLRPIEL